MDLRVPDYRRENALSAELKAAYDAGQKDILRPSRLVTVFSTRTTPVSGQITIWQPIEFAYPCILYPITQLGTGASGSGKLFAYLGDAPDTPPGIGTFAIQSRGGILEIPIPGTWWVGYDGIVDEKVQCMVFDNTCGAAQDLIRKQNVIIRELGVVNVLTGGATNIVSDDQYRDGVILQNQGTVDVWVRRGQAGSSPAAVGTGYKIPPGETLALVGDVAYKGPLNGRADGVNCNVWPWDLAS